MTTIDYAASATTAPATTGFLNGALAAFNAPALFLKRRFIAIQTRNELSGLSDRQLDDIGLIRSDIEDISAEMAARATF